MAGADAVLLIAEILADDELRFFRERAEALGMAALVEFHDPANLDRVVRSGAKLIGINNRDLTRFVTDLHQTTKLRAQLPDDVVVVSESGISTNEDVQLLQDANVQAILVGETLMKAADVGLAVDQLLGFQGQIA
jgi:indole-3-glycerol phosphate synthase